MPKVSVIIPVYNVEEYLPECLDSVVNQTLKDIEIICVDDGSTDNSLEILKEYAKKDPRIKVLTQKNQGAGAARNKGLKVAEGEYLYFIDGDDYIEPEALKKVYDRITETNAEICVFKNGVYQQTTDTLEPCNWEHLIQNIPNKQTFNKYDIPTVFFQFCNIPAWSKFYRTSFIRKNNLKFQNLKTCNDVYFNYMSLVSAKSITFLNETLLVWRTGHSNTTASRNKYTYCILKAFQAIKNNMKKNDFKLLSDSFYKGAKGCFRYEIGRIDESKKKDYWILKLYKFLPEQYWTKQAFDTKKKQINMIKNFVQKIFSIKNDTKHKIINVVGIKIKIKSQKLVYKTKIDKLEKRVKRLEEKLKEKEEKCQKLA